MAFDLTLTSPTYNATGKYGASLNGGHGMAASVFTGLTAFTIEAWFKTTSTGTIVVVAGQGGLGYISVDASGKALAHYGNSPDVTVLSTVTVNDGAWHHMALCVTASVGGKLWVDGVLAVTVNTPATISTSLNSLGVRAFRYASNTIGFPFPGEVDEVAVWAGEQYTATFTPGSISDSAPNLRAVWHLDSNGIDSAGAADVTAPTATSAAVANGAPTVVAITMSEVMDAGNVPAASAFTVAGHTVSSVSISGTVVNLTCSAPFVNGEAARTVAYTQPGANNARDVAGNLLANFSGLSITNNVNPAGDTTAPTFASAQVTNSTPTVVVLTFNETLAASTPAASAFSVSGGKTVSSVAAPIGATIAITVNSAYVYGDVITVTYTAPGADPRVQDAAGNVTSSFGPSAVTNNIAAPIVNSFDVTKIQFSPGNWNEQPTFAKTINAGAYLRTIFGGATCTLTFDMAGLSTPYPKLSYRVDRFGAWTTVDLAASIVVTVPSELSGYGSHLLELDVRSTSEAVQRWSPQACGVVLTGVTLATGKSLTKPTALPLMGIFFGDSIQEGINSITNSGDATVRSDSGQAYPRQVGRILGAEVGVVAFGGQGWTDTGSGGIPGFDGTYNYLYSGVARTFPVNLDFIAICHGQNDGSVNTVSAATTILNGLIAATNRTTKIILMRPFSGLQAANIQAAIAACSDPTRCVYINTTGFFTTANSTDTVHPYGWEHVTHIAPSVAAAIRPYIVPIKGSRVARIISVTFESRLGAARANLTGLKWSWFDQSSQELLTVAADSGTGATTDASGVFSVSSVFSTLAPGAEGWLQVGDGSTNQLAFSGKVTVS